MTQGKSEVDADAELLEISGVLFKASGRARLQGNVCLFFTIIIGAGILSLFAFSGLSDNSISLDSVIGFREALESEAFNTQNQDALKSLSSTLAEINSSAGQDGELRRELLEMAFPSLGSSERIDQFRSAQNSLSPIIGSSVVRIGSVLIGIFLIQIMVGFSRYYYRLAEHFKVCSVVLRLSKGDVGYMQSVIPLLMPSNIEFGKMPNSPLEKIVDSAFQTIGEVSKKIPSR